MKLNNMKYALLLLLLPMITSAQYSLSPKKLFETNQRIELLERRVDSMSYTLFLAAKAAEMSSFIIVELQSRIVELEKRPYLTFDTVSLWPAAPDHYDGETPVYDKDSTYFFIGPMDSTLPGLKPPLKHKKKKPIITDNGYVEPSDKIYFVRPHDLTFGLARYSL